MIQFANLTAAYFAASLLAILLFHLLTQRLQRVTVSSTHLWRELAAETKARRPKLRLRLSWLLLAQLLLAAALVTAMMEPLVRGVAGEGQVVIVLDGSASMQADDADPSRFEAAQRAAQEYAGQVEGAETALVFAGDPPRLAQDFTRDAEAVRRSISELQPTMATQDIDSALAVAEGILEHPEQARIVLFTDAAHVPPTTELTAAFELRSFGDSTPNTSIVRAEAVRTDRANYDLLVTVSHQSPEDSTIPVAVTRDGEPIAEETVSLPPYASKDLVFSIPTTGRHEIVVSIPPDGSRIPAGTEVALSLGRDEDPRVLLVTPGNFFLERALLAYPAIRLFTRAEAGDDLDTFDMVIFDRVEPIDTNTPVFYIYSPPPEAVGRTQEFDRTFQITSIRQGHPLLRFVELGYLRASRFMTIPAGAGITPLIEAPEGIVSAAYQSESASWVYLGMPLSQTNLPLQVSFPVFIGSILDWLVPGEVSVSPTVPPSEADLRPQWDEAMLPAGTLEVAAESVMSPAWMFLVAMAMVLLGIEWWLFVKGGAHAG